MQTDTLTIEMMRDLLGQVPMGTETGMQTLYQALASGFPQVVVLHGQVERIKQQLPHRSREIPMRAAPIPDATAPDHESGQAQGTVPTDTLRQTLKHMISDWLKIGVEEIDSEKDLSEYGLDSIILTALTNRLNQIYQLDLTPALLFEYSTIESLAQYLTTTYAAVLAPHFATASSEMPTHTNLAPEPVMTDEVPSGAASSQRRVPIAHEAVLGNRILFLKANDGSQEEEV
jgi:polyketide synthase PksJ